MIRTLEVGAVDIEAIKDQFPLADFVAETVALKKTGNALRGLCPFHGEKTPSFYVYPDQRYHCFGCSAHGDLFDFAHHIRGWDIRETARQLGGGHVPTYTPDRIEEIRAKRAAAEREDAERRQLVIEESRLRWEAAVPAVTHPYLTAKGIEPHNARVEATGTLLTPITGPDGRIQCVQSIAHDGTKDFPWRGTVSGGFTVLGGRVADAATVYLCEGYATAASIAQATGGVAICAYNSGNMTKVASFFAGRYADREWIVAADADEAGRKAGADAAAILKGRVALPETTGTDFNDMAAEHGLPAVKALIEEGLLPDGNVVQPPSVPIRSLAPFDARAIPPRPWIVPGWLLEKQVAMLIAPPGVGKSTITLHQAIAVATGTPWGGWTVDRPGNVLLINVEDDPDEMMRRTAAALDTMGIDQSAIEGKLFIHDCDREFLITKAVDNSKEIIWSPLVDQLQETIRRHDIRLTIVDPFAETYNGQENDNNEMKRAATGFRHIARQTDSAVCLVHHTSKAGSGAHGDMYSSRGGSASVGVVRTAATLFPMTKDDAAKFGMPEKDTRLYVRWDDAKSNQSLIGGEPRWFKKTSVVIPNGHGLAAGDSVGSLVEWSPPDVFETISIEVANRILDDLAAGTWKEDRRARDEGTWAGLPIMRIAERTEEQAVRILKEWKANGVIETFKDRDPATRHMRVFVRPVDGMRPK